MRIMPSAEGKFVAISFFDHCLGSDAEVIECTAFGKVVEVSQREIILEYWSIHTRDKETEEDNRERVAIVQDCIFEYVEFTPKKARRFF